jgi:hypothetical protein
VPASRAPALPRAEGAASRLPPRPSRRRCAPPDGHKGRGYANRFAAAATPAPAGAL